MTIIRTPRPTGPHCLAIPEHPGPLIGGRPSTLTSAMGGPEAWQILSDHWTTSPQENHESADPHSRIRGCWWFGGPLVRHFFLESVVVCTVNAMRSEHARPRWPTPCVVPPLSAKCVGAPIDLGEPFDPPVACACGGESRALLSPRTAVPDADIPSLERCHGWPRLNWPTYASVISHRSLHFSRWNHPMRDFFPWG